MCSEPDPSLFPGFSGSGPEGGKEEQGMRIQDVAIGQLSQQDWSNLSSSKGSVEVQRKINAIEDIFLCARA